MAGKGTYGAYKRLTPIDDAFGQNLDHTEKMGFYYRREERLAKEKKDKAIEDQAKKLGVALADLEITDTGIKDIDAPVYDYIMRTTNKLTELSRRIAKDPNDMEARILFEKYQNSAKHLKGFTEKFGSYQTDLREGIKSKKYSKELNKGVSEGISKSLLQGQYKLVNDKNGDLQLFVDMDGDGLNDNQFQTVNVREFLNGNALYDPKQAYDSYAVQDKIAARFGTVDKKTDTNGYKTVTYKGFDPKKTDQLKEEVNKTLGTYDKMTDAARSILADGLGKTISDMDEKSFNEFREDFAQDIINTFNKEEGDEFDHARRNADDSNRRLNEKHNERNKENSGEQGKPFLEQAKNEKGEPITETVGGEDGNVLTFPKDTAPEVDGKAGDRLELYDDGELGLVVKKVIKTTKKDEDTGEDITTTSYEDEVIRDKKKLSVAFRGYKDPATGKEFKNLQEIYEYGETQLYSKALTKLDHITQEEIDAIE